MEKTWEDFFTGAPVINVDPVVFFTTQSNVRSLVLMLFIITEINYPKI
jgi:hypothetical protein